MARQIVDAPPMQAFMCRLFMEARAIEITLEALAALCRRPSSVGTRLSPRDRERLLALRAQIDSDTGPVPDLARLASDVGMSAATLQRKFRSLTGSTLFGYIRRARLEQSRAGLETGGLSVEQAAELAGYTRPENFATAFRRQFAASPRSFKRLR